MNTRQRVAGAALAAVVILALGLAGCGGQNDTVGEGKISLVFNNNGNTQLPMVVSWVDNAGQTQELDFTVLVGGRVTVKVPPRTTYKTAVNPDCGAGAAAVPGAKPQDEVIEVGK
ncbi:MAG TPA: hypothetical protein VGM19_06855 [Armatimonadota bacterium]